MKVQQFHVTLIIMTQSSAQEVLDDLLRQWRGETERIVIRETTPAVASYPPHQRPTREAGRG